MLRAAGCNDSNALVQIKRVRQMLHKERFRDPDDFEVAVRSLRPWIIRHTLETLPLTERKRMGEVRHVFGSLISPEDADALAQREVLQAAIRIQDPRLKQMILHAERLKQLCPKELRGAETLVAPYSPAGLRRIAEDIKNSSDSSDPSIYHAESIIHLTSSIDGQGPMEQALYDFALECFRRCEKFIVFCYHHQVADTLHKILQSAAKNAKLEIVPPEPEALRKAFDTQKRRRIEPCEETAEDPEQTCTAKLEGDVIDSFSADHFRYLKSYEQKHNIRISDALEDLCAKIRSTNRRGSSGASMEIVETLKDARHAIIGHFFNSPFFPMALVATTKDSEGIDLHRHCRIVVHYELGYRPETLLQANGRVRRVGSWAGQTSKPVLYYYPYLEGTRSEALTREVVKRVERFGHLMGGVPDVAPDRLAAAVAARTEGVHEREMPELDFTNGGFCKILHLP